MELQSEQFNGGIIKVNLVGRLDIAGTEASDLRFRAVTATGKTDVIVDLSRVDFIASIGLRMLVLNAKALNLSGGKMVIYKPGEMVRKVIETTGIDAIIPIFDDIDSAARALKQT